MSTPAVDDIVSVLEGFGLGWDVGRTGGLIEARIWAWPEVVGRARFEVRPSVSEMLLKAAKSEDLEGLCEFCRMVSRR